MGVKGFYAIDGIGLQEQHGDSNKQYDRHFLLLSLLRRLMVYRVPGVKSKLLGWLQGPTWALLTTLTFACSMLPRSLFSNCVLVCLSGQMEIQSMNITVYSASPLMMDSRWILISSLSPPVTDGHASSRSVRMLV